MAQKIGTIFVRLNFTKYEPIFKIISLSEPTKKDPTTPQLCYYTTLHNVKCLKSNNRKQDDFCNNTFKKLTT